MMMECILQVPAFSVDGSNFSLWGSGEWWMLLAAQSMAVGTVMIRWITKYSDPVMATGWVGYTNLYSCEIIIKSQGLVILPRFSGYSLEKFDRLHV